MLFEIPKVEETTPKLPETKEKIYPRPYHSNSRPSEFDKVKNNTEFDNVKGDIKYRLRLYDFFPELIKGYQCYPECMLLFDALSLYLDNFASYNDRDVDTVVFLLRQTDLREYEQQSNLDILLSDVGKTDPDARCFKAYQAFKSSSPTRQKDAIALLYQYFTFERYLINREEAYI